VPKGARGEKPPGDVIGAAIMVAKIATGEVEDNAKAVGAASFARQGGEARARKLSATERCPATHCVGGRSKAIIDDASKHMTDCENLR
jgi:hypothetical protein